MTSFEKGKLLRIVAICARLMKPWEGVGQNKRQMPLLLRTARHLYTWRVNDQRGLEVFAGRLRCQFACGGDSFGTVNRAYLRLVGPSESSSASSSPCRSFFEVDRPDWVYQ